MTYQEIKVDALGRPVCAYDEKEPVSLRVLGRQTIERFSMIEHDADLQRFYIVFDRSSPYRAGREVTINDFKIREVEIPVDFETEEDSTYDRPLFARYADAILAERALLSAMMRTGEL